MGAKETRMRTPFLHTPLTGRLPRYLALIGVALAWIALLGSRTASAQVFDSGSNGSDGALNLTQTGTPIEFDPVALGLDTDGDNIYHFTTITIAAGVTVRLTARKINGPVFWLASGAVQIDGVIDLDGEDGQGLSPTGVPMPTVPGAGGFAGGVKGGPGFGPFGGPGLSGGSQSCFRNAFGGGGPGNRFLVPLSGGSGGASGGGDASRVGWGGGAGGGALLIASSVSITVTGTIMANGGDGFSFQCGGGGGGGGLRLVAPIITGTGALQARGGGRRNAGPNCQPCGAGGGTDGGIRLEAFQHAFTGTTAPGPILASPFALFLPLTTPPVLRVVSVAGILVASDPTGSFTMPDVTFNAATAVPVLIEAHNIPLGTIVQLHLFSENGADQILDSTPLAGSLQLSTATASAVIPPGFSRGFVRATWTP